MPPLKLVSRKTMKKRKLEDVDYNDDDDDNDNDNDNDSEELRAVFVDTNLDTHLVVLVSPLFSFSLLKESIVMEHSKCFPDFGEIKIRALKVKREKNYYHLSERMLLRTAFHGAEGWFVFADVDGNPFSRPPNAQSISVKQLQLNHSNHLPVSNLQIPKNPSEKFDSKSAQRELNSSCPEATNHPKKKKKKRKTEATEHKDFASGFSVENMHKIESNNSIKQPLLESMIVISGVEGGASKPKFLASKEDDLQQNGVAASIVLPSKVAETSTSGQVRKREEKHVHDSSSVSTDAAVETNIDTAKGTSQLMGHLEGSGKILGSTLNQESVIHSFEAKSEPRAKKTKKTKKSGCDGVDRRYAVNLGKGPGDENLFLQKESDNSAEGTPLKPTGNSELLVSQHKALYSGEKTGAEEEDVPSFKSSEFNKTTESDNTSKTRKTSKAMSSVTDKQNLSGIKENSDLESADTRQKGTTTGETLNKVSGSRARKNKANTKDVGVNISLAAQLGQVPNIDQYDVTVSDSEKVICERESNSKITVEEEIMESGAIPKKKKTSRIKTSVKAKNDLSIPSHINDQELTDSIEEAAEMLQPTDTRIELRVGSVSNKKTHTEDSSGLPSKDLSSETMKDMTSAKIVIDDCLRDNGTHDLADQHQMYHEEVNDNSARLVSADVAEETKVIMSKRSKQKKKKSKENVRTSQALPMVMSDNQEAAGTELLAESSKHEENSELKSSRENGTHGISYQSQVHYEVLNDMSACLVSANVAEGAMVDMPKENKQKTKRSRENESPSQVLPKIMNNDLEATDSGLLQPSKCSRSQENSELKSVNPKKRSKSRQTTSSVGVADILLADDCLRENGTHDTADQSQVYNEVLNDIPAGLVSANVAEGTVVDKSNARKKKTKKSIGNEKTSQVLPQIMNDELEAASTGLLQPSKSSNPEEDSELRSVNKKKRSKCRQTVSSAGVSEIHVAELVTEGKKVDDDILTNSGMRGGNKDQNALGNGEREHSNEISVQKVSAHEANVGNLEKRTRSKSKRKKLDQHSSVDTSSNLITSEKGYESERNSLVKEFDPSSNLLKKLQSGFHEEEQMGAAGVEVFQPSQVSNCEANEEITSDKPEQRVQVKRPASGQQLDVKMQRTVEEQADDGMANRIAYDAEKQEEVSLHEKCHDGSSDVKLDDQQARKLKGKKLDLSSSVDTSPGHNLITSKKGKESERNVQVFSELQNDIQESETLSQIASKPLQLHQASQHEEHLEVQNLQVNNTMQKAAFSANILPEVEHSGVLLTNDNVDADRQTKGLCVAEIRPEKSSVCKMKVKNLDLPTSVEIKPKGVNNTLSTKEIECEKNSPDLGQLQKSITKIDHGRKPHSIKNDSASFKKVDTQVSVGDPFNARSGVLGQNIHVRKSGVKGPNMDNGSRCSGTSSLMSGKSAEKTHVGKNMETQKKNNEGHIYKTPSNKIMGAPVNSLPQKRHLPPTSGGLFGDISSDSSDGEVERSGSSSSTRTPEDLSSSDYSEGENVGDVATSQHESKGSRSARDKANLNLTALKDLDLSTVIRSSSRYKKAKLAASQSQMEDGESELPEFVPDSLPVTDF